MQENPLNGETLFQLEAIVSSGELGADRAALDFALANTIRHFGFCPHGRPCEGGCIPLRYTLIETLSDGVSESIFLNVSASDGTVLFDPLPARRSLRNTCVTAFCKSARHPLLILRSRFDVEDDVRQLTGFICSLRLSSLHVTGLSESEMPGIYEHVTTVLRRLPIASAPVAKTLSRTFAAGSPADKVQAYSTSGRS